MDMNGSILRIGLVGHGKRGKKFIKAIGAVPRLKLVAICDINGRITEDIPVFKSVAEMVKIPFDVGIVCVPHDVHFEISKELLENGIHVLKEKPFARSFKEAKELQSLASKNNVKLMISTQKRFSSAYMKCKDMISKGLLGSVSCLDARHTLSVANPEKDNWRRKESADIVLDLGYHMLDIIAWLIGVPEEIYGLSNEKNHYQDFKAGDSCSITFRKVSEDGKTVIGNIFLAAYTDEKQEHLAITGTKGSIVIKDGQVFKHLDPERKLISEENLECEPLQNVLIQFMKTIDKADQSPLNNSVDQVLTMKFVDAVRNNVKPSDNINGMLAVAERFTQN